MAEGGFIGAGAPRPRVDVVTSMGNQISGRAMLAPTDYAFYKSGNDIEILPDA